MIRLFFSMILALGFAAQAMADDSLHCKVSDKESVDISYNSTTKKEVVTYHKTNSPDRVSSGLDYKLLIHDDLKNTADGKTAIQIVNDAPKQHQVVKTEDIPNIDSVGEFLTAKDNDSASYYLKYYDKNKKVLGSFGVVGWAIVYCDGKNDY